MALGGLEDEPAKDDAALESRSDYRPIGREERGVILKLTQRQSNSPQRLSQVCKCLAVPLGGSRRLWSRQ